MGGDGEQQERHRELYVLPQDGLRAVQQEPTRGIQQGRLFEELEKPFGADDRHTEGRANQGLGVLQFVREVLLGTRLPIIVQVII